MLGRKLTEEELRPAATIVGRKLDGDQRSTMPLDGVLFAAGGVVTDTRLLGVMRSVVSRERKRPRCLSSTARPSSTRRLVLEPSRSASAASGSGFTTSQNAIAPGFSRIEANLTRRSKPSPLRVMRAGRVRSSLVVL
jgi:hypothetical protein